MESSYLFIYLKDVLKLALYYGIGVNVRSNVLWSLNVLFDFNKFVM